MKKILALILALGMSFAICSGFAGADYSNKAYADGNKKDEGTVGTIEGPEPNPDVMMEFLVLQPQVVLNQGTGCYDIDIFVISSNWCFSNFEAVIHLATFDNLVNKTPLEELSAKASVKMYVRGNCTATIKNGDLRIAFNATDNVDLRKGLEGNDGAKIMKVATVKTNIEHNLKIENRDGKYCFVKGLYICGGDYENASAGVMSHESVIPFSVCGALSEIEINSLQEKFPFIAFSGDYDFDGELTIKDIIAAQYYLTNGIEFGEITLCKMLNSIGIQYLQMYLCEKISYSRYLEQVSSLKYDNLYFKYNYSFAYQGTTSA